MAASFCGEIRRHATSGVYATGSPLTSQKPGGTPDLPPVSLPVKFACCQFRFVRQRRNDAVHGQLVGSGVEAAREAEFLLRAILKAELNMTNTLPWESHPRIRGVNVDWQYGHNARS